jgi:hypothetical protein
MMYFRGRVVNDRGKSFITLASGCNIPVDTLASISDSGNDSPDAAQSLQVGQRETDGALLLGRTGRYVR